MDSTRHRDPLPDRRVMGYGPRPPGSSMPSRPTGRWSSLIAFCIPLGVCAVLWWPIPIHLDTWHVHTAFADSHVWVFDRLARGAFDALPLADCMAGFPTAQTMRAIGWAPGLLAILLRPLLGALGAANLIQLVSLPLSAVAATALIRRTTDSDPVVAALLGAAYGLCPTLLGTFATGEISNTQAWILPALLLAVHLARQGSMRALLAVFTIGLISPFTSPYYALALPFLGGFAVLPGLRHTATRARSLTVLGVLAASLLPAWPYYSGDAAGGRASLFRPARARDLFPAELPHPAPVAQPETLLWHSAPAPGSDVETLHVTALGVALLALALWGLWRQRRAPGRTMGLALVAGGVLAALGPVLYAGGQLRGLGSTALPLPVALLEAVDWPTRQGGLYFRYAVLAELGLVVLGAMALRRRRHARWVAAAVLVLHVAEGVRASGPWSERTRSPVHGRTLLEGLAGHDGAVLELPVQGPTDGWFGQGALLRAVYHQRPTTALPRAIQDRRHPVHLVVRDAFRQSDPEQVGAVLRSAGYRLVVLPERLVPHVDPPFSILSAALGPPDHDDGLYVWDLGPTEVRCAPALDRTTHPASP